MHGGGGLAPKGTVLGGRRARVAAAHDHVSNSGQGAAGGFIGSSHMYCTHLLVLCVCACRPVQ